MRKNSNTSDLSTSECSSTISPKATIKRNIGLSSVLQKNCTRFNNTKLFDLNTTERTCLSISRFAAVKLLWASIIVIGTYYTITMCFDLLYSYRCDPPYSKITVFKNDTFILPFVKICLPIYTAPYLRNETATTSYQDTVNKYLNGPTPVSAESFLGTDPWPKSFLHVAHEYLAFLTDAQIYTGAAGFERYKENSSDQWQSFLEIEKYLPESSVTIDQLLQKFGRDIMRLYDIKGTLHWFNNKTDTNFSLEKTIAVSMNRVCFKSEPHIPFDLTDASHSINFVFDRTNLLSAEPNASFPKAHVHYDMIDYTIFDVIDSPATVFAFGYETNVRLTTPAEYRSLPEVNGVKKCSTKTPYQTCRSKCRADYIRRTCGCEPIAWPELTSTEEQSCSLQKLATCELSPDIGFSNCSLRYSCLPFCRQGAYTETTTTTTLADKYAQIQLYFYGAQFFQLYEETWPWTTESFVGAFGGVLGLWLGLNLLVLLKLLLTLIGFCGRICQRMFDKEKINICTEKGNRLLNLEISSIERRRASAH